MSEPALSVVVPVFGSWADVPELLDALAAQDRPDFEIVLVDNNPTPATAPAWPPALEGRARVLRCPTPGSYAARNAGAAAARGAHLAFTDADCRPEPGWAGALVDALAAWPASLLAGPVRVRPEGAPNAWAVFDAVRGIPQEAYVRRGYATTANLALPRALFEALGGFDATRLSGGDAELCRRARARGVPLALVPGAVVGHPARASREALATKARRVKGGQVAAGPSWRRALWTVRSVTPPLREVAGYLVSPYPWRWRLTAAGVRFLLWRVELVEVARLLVLRGAPERR